MRINTFRNRLLISLLLALPSYTLLFLIRGYSFEEMTLYAHAEYSAVVFCILGVLFEFHHAKSRALDDRLPWRQSPHRRGVAEISGTLLATPAIVTPFVYLLYRLIWDMDLWWPGVVEYNLFALPFSLLMAVYVNTDPLLDDWKRSLVRSEALEKESVKARLGMLRSQVSPHFLFNNFNVLDALIEEDPNLAQRYLEKLAVIYRYVLNHRSEEVVPLAEELDFIRDYLFLLGIRYEGQLDCRLEVKGSRGAGIPPATLQILVENAIKHNVLSADRPLRIRLRAGEEDYLVVENTLRPKKRDSRGTGFGLENIVERYNYLTALPVLIEREEETFAVHIPLINL